MAKYHKIWRVFIKSENPNIAPRCYLIESSHKNGGQTITKKALALAAEDGMESPRYDGMEWINNPHYSGR